MYKSRTVSVGFYPIDVSSYSILVEESSEVILFLPLSILQARTAPILCSLPF